MVLNQWRWNGYHCLVKFIVVIVLICSHSMAWVQEPEPRYDPKQFENPERDHWQMVDRIIEAIGLKPGDCIADIGGGTGYFSRPFARVVGPQGVVYCCDIATNLMDYLHEKAKEEGLDNIVTVYAALDRPMLPPSSVDIIFFCDTNHHLYNRVTYYRGLHKILRPNGKLVIVDWKKEKQKVGPPPEHNVDRSVVITEMAEAGWVKVQEETFLPYQYFMIFQPESQQ